MSIGAEVRIRLGVDDAMAHAAIAKASAGFGALHKQAMSAARGIGSAVGGFAKNMLMAAGIGGAAGGLSSVVGAAIDATKAAESQKRAIAGALALTDQTGASYDVLKQKAGGMRAEFVEMGMKAGVMASTVTEIFTELAERSGKSTDEVKKLTEQILAAGRVTGDTEMLTRGMRMLEMGMTSARNPIVAMIRSTGVLKGSIHDVAAALGKMKPEQQMAAGEEAIRRLAQKAKGMEPTFGMLANQMRQMKENILEDIGGPLMKGIIPSLMELQKWIQSHRKEIEHVAQTIGAKVGAWVTAAAKLIGEAFKYLQTHAEDIKGAIMFAAGALKSAVGFLIDHKEIIAGMLTVKGLSALGVGGAPAAAAGAAVGLLGAGFAAIDKAFSHKDTESTGGGEAANARATWGRINADMAKAGAGFYRNQQAVEGVLAHEGTLTRSMYASQGEEGRQTVVKFFAEVRAQAASSQKLIANNLEWLKSKAAEQLKAANDMPGVGAGASAWEKGAGVEAQAARVDQIGKHIGELYNFATNAHEQGIQQEAIRLLVSSSFARVALVNSGVEIAGGVDALVAKVGESSAQAADSLKKMFATKATLDKPTFQQNFSGGQTFHVTQDFRKADPDDVVLATRKDVFKRAAARGFAKTAIFNGM